MDDEEVVEKRSGVYYECRRCDVRGVANKGEFFVCWCCEKGDALTTNKIGGMSKNTYTANFAAAIGPGPGRIDDN